MDYDKLTLDTLVKFVMNHPRAFPSGMNTEITSGDFEGNYYHEKFELQKNENKIHLGFELHEF